LVVFGIGAFAVNAITPRLPLRSDAPRLRWIKLATDLGLAVMLTGVARLAGWRAMLAWLPAMWLAATFGGG
jgi:hypothetical protein